MRRPSYVRLISVHVAALSAALTLSAGQAPAAGDSAATAQASGLISAAGVRRFALVVGNNAPPRDGLVRLRYADDDAVRWAVLLQTFGTDVELLTELDKDSQKLYGNQAPVHRAPTDVEMTAALGRLFRKMSEARAANLRTTFYFVYAGHGDIDGGEGYLALSDRRFFRHDLEERILAASPANTNHVIIDACRSFYVAYDRGPGGRRRPWRQPYFTAGAAARFPNTGFLLASSSGGASHEWEEFQSGIFSHEVRSGLLGGADGDGDGEISYGEITAFVRVANQSVRNERFRPDILAHPPQTGEQMLVAIRDARTGHLRLGGGRGGRHVLEDSIGVRWADIHPGPTQPVTLALPGSTWGSDELYLRSLATDTEYRFPRQQLTRLADLTPQVHSALRRGAIHDAFAQLFATPFDNAAMTALPAADLQAEIQDQLAERRHRYRQVATVGTGTLAVASLAWAGYHMVAAARLRRDNQNAEGIERPAINGRIADHNRSALIGVVAGSALVAATVGLLLWDRHATDSDSGEP